jgi:hypothetical protein
VTAKQGELLQQQWDELRELMGRAPSFDQWQWHIQRKSFDDFWLGISVELKGQLIGEAFRDFQIHEERNGEIDEKTRYAEINLNCRAYTDGSF